MINILLLYNRKIKNSPLDIVTMDWAEDNRAQVFKATSIKQNKKKFKVVIPRQTMVQTQNLERIKDTWVINSYVDRTMAKNKFILNKKLNELGILTPYTIPFSRARKIYKALKFPLIIKPIFTAYSQGIIELKDLKEIIKFKKNDYEILNRHYILQEKIEGDLYKVYGPIGKKWIYVNKITNEEKWVPERIAKNCSKIIKAYNLVYAGIDFIVKDNQWYAIDLNVTTGCKSLSLKNTRRLTDWLLKDYADPLPRVTSAGGIVIQENKGKLKLVLVYDPKKKPNGWVLPKGHIKIKETKIQAAIRATQEESGLRELKPLCFLDTIKKVSREHDGKQVNKTTYYYLIYGFDKKTTHPHFRDKHTRMSWFTPQQAMKVCYYHQEAKLIKRLLVDEDIL